MRIATLKKNKEFNMTYSRGKSYPAKRIILICLKRKYGGVRFGFTASKKVGCAVKRNRVRRQLKEAVAPEISKIRGNWHLIFVARKGIAETPFCDIKGDVLYLLKKAGLIQ